MSRPRIKTRRTEDLSQDPHWQDVRSSANWLHLHLVPYNRDPLDKSSPRTTSLRLARQVSASHDHPPAPTGTWVWRGASTGREHYHRRAWGTIPHVMQIQQLAAMQAAHLDKSLTAGVTSCAAIPSPSSLALPHASSAHGTQAPLYDAHEPRLKLGRGGLVRYSGRLRQAQTTRRRS
jgi:hypothetical protein